MSEPSRGSLINSDSLVDFKRQVADLRVATLGGQLSIGEPCKIPRQFHRASFSRVGMLVDCLFQIKAHDCLLHILRSDHGASPQEQAKIPTIVDPTGVFAKYSESTLNINRRTKAG